MRHLQNSCPYSSKFNPKKPVSNYCTQISIDPELLLVESKISNFHAKKNYDWVPQNHCKC